MRNFEETDFDFDFEEGIKINRTRDFRIEGDYQILSIGGEEVFTPERKARVLAHQKRIQKGLRGKR